MFRRFLVRCSIITISLTIFCEPNEPKHEKDFFSELLYFVFVYSTLFFQFRVGCRQQCKKKKSTSSFFLIIKRFEITIDLHQKIINGIFKSTFMMCLLEHLLLRMSISFRVYRGYYRVLVHHFVLIAFSNSYYSTLVRIHYRITLFKFNRECLFCQPIIKELTITVE